jgi:hypothetical protein
MTSALKHQSLDQIFRSVRTPNGWTDRPVEQDTVREIYDLMEWGPTSANSSPAQFFWVRGTDGKATGFDFDFWTGDSIHTESSRKFDAQSFTRLAELGGWDVAELWTDADRLFAVFGPVAAEPVQGG